MTERSAAKVAYVLGVGPQPESPFTHDEIDALDELIDVERVAVMMTANEVGWTGPAGRWSAPSAWAVLATLFTRPLRLGGAVISLLRAGGLAPRDLAVAVRSAMAACYLASRVDPAVIHAQFAGPAAATAFVWHRLTGIPYSVRAHAYDIYTPYRWLGPVLRNSSAVIAISEHGREHLASQGFEGVRVVHVGVPVSAIARRSPREAATPFRVLSVGALSPKKGHTVTVRAIRELVRRGRDVHLDIVGTGPLQSELADIAPPGRVTFRGWVPNRELRAAYADYDLFLMTSQRTAAGDSDGIPVALMEAMAAGLPVVATVVGGMAELLVDGVTGQVASSDPVALADQLETTMDDYGRALRLTNAARDRVSADFDVVRQAQVLTEIWGNLAGSSEGAA